MFVTKKRYKQVQEWADRNQEAYLSATRMVYEQHIRTLELADALRDIIAESTAKPNATVKRMVKIAEEALGIVSDDEVETAPEESTVTSEEVSA